jgi:hypothetical protein
MINIHYTYFTILKNNPIVRYMFLFILSKVGTNPLNRTVHFTPFQPNLRNLSLHGQSSAHTINHVTPTNPGIVLPFTATNTERRRIPTLPKITVLQ